jgi:nitrous oxidase accessory protein
MSRAAGAPMAPVALLALLALLACALGQAAAAEIRVLPGEALPALAPGDVVVLAPGRHEGPWRVTVQGVTLRAEPGAVLDGLGLGSALELRAPGITVEGLTVTGVGPERDLYEPDAAAYLHGCHGCEVRGLRAHGVTAGFRVQDSDDVVIAGADMSGDGRGPGVTAYYAPGLRVEDVTLHGFLDGVYLERSDDLRVQRATITGSQRYGVHLMFSAGGVVEQVVAQGGGVGSAVMYGRATVLRDARFEGHGGPMAFGLLVQEEANVVIERVELARNTIGLLAIRAPGLEVRDVDFDANGFGALLKRVPATWRSSVDDGPTTLRIVDSRFRRNAFDLAVDDDEADVHVAGNAYDRAPPLDLGGDGVLDAPHVVGASLAALAARVPDVSLMAFGPSIALWEAVEARVPGARWSTLADMRPRAEATVRDARARWTWALLAPLALGAIAAASRPRGSGT